jgi:hypothetical protein
MARQVSKLPQIFKPYDTVGQIMAYESGELDEDAIVTLFQHLVDTGMVWQLQGSYGRTAVRLMRDGLIKAPQNGQGKVQRGSRNPHHVSD